MPELNTLTDVITIITIIKLTIPDKKLPRPKGNELKGYWITVISYTIR